MLSRASAARSRPGTAASRSPCSAGPAPSWPSARLWPQTEYLKAALILGEEAEVVAGPHRGVVHRARLVEALGIAIGRGPEAKAGGYYGPQGFQEMRGGDVGPAKIGKQALNEQAAKRLWEICESLTNSPNFL